jgi:AAA family ATP:ADP antiporter
MLNIFILLTAYYIIKPVREALILGALGAEVKSYTGALQALAFLIIVPIYGAFANRVNRLHLINGVTGFFLTNLLIFYALGHFGVPIGIPFFIWVGMFNVMLVAQVWAFANDIYTQEEGHRLLAITGIGSSLGAIFGAYLAKQLFEPMGPYAMMVLSAALLSLCMVLTVAIHRREKSKPTVRNRPRTENNPINGQGAFNLIFRHRYLLLIAFMVLLTNLVNTTGEFILGKAVKMQAETVVAAGTEVTQEQYIGKFYADFFFWVNVVGALLQLFLVSRLIKYLGVSLSLFFLPIIALGSYTLLAFAPVLGLVRLAKISENSTDYSIQNTARHSLFLRTGRDAKFKAKTAIDNFFWRVGDAGSALVVFVGTQLAFGLRGFAIVNIILVMVWLIVVVGIARVRSSEAVPSVELRPAA